MRGKRQTEDQPKILLTISLHGYRNILAPCRQNPIHSLALRDDVIEESPIVWDELGSTARRSTRVEDEYNIGRGVVGA